VLDGVAATVVGLTFATGLRSAWQGSPGALPLTIAAVTVLCVGILRWPLIPVVLVLAPLSIGLAFGQPRHR
jgi:chromate transporter